MADVLRSTGVRIEFDETLCEVSTEPPSVATRSAAPSAARPADDVAAALTQQGFELLDEVDITAAPTVRGAVAPRARVEVPVGPHEHAVLLVARDDVYEWVWPEVQVELRSRSARPRAADVAVFHLPAEVARRDTDASTRGGAPFVHSRVKTWVLRFIADKAMDLAIALLERNVETRLVDMRSGDPAEWTTAAPRNSPNAVRRVLLFVHGTFSSTVGGYHALAATARGKAFLEWARAHYDETLGYDHPTLSLDPEENADDLLARLTERFGSATPTIDIIAHSRGGLVARSLVEVRAPATHSALAFDRIVMVGCTNAGTHLAAPANWKAFVDFYTNLSAHAVRAIGGAVGQLGSAALLEAGIRSVGAVVKLLAVRATDEQGVPGLAAMSPVGTFVAQLNKHGATQPRARYFVVQTEFAADLQFEGVGALPRTLTKWIADKFVDQFFDGAPNDLVVDTASMSAIDLPTDGLVVDTHAFDKNGVVTHVNYFTHDVVAEKLRLWLGD